MVDWKLKSFNELTLNELYAILRLRTQVFVVEQNSPYLDEDNKDQKSFHMMGWREEVLVVYARLLPIGVAYQDIPSIGRVVTDKSIRGAGIGKELIKKCINECYHLFGKQPIKIGAQLYLKKFYESFGFIQTSEEYLEDGILHIEMIK